MSIAPAPILIVGAGHMGGALLAGWRRAGTYQGRDFIIVDPAPGSQALWAADDGARLNPPTSEYADAEIAVLAIKPQAWRAAAAELEPLLNPRALLISVMAGAPARALAKAFKGRTVARVMPNTAAAIGQGATSIFCQDAEFSATVRWLFEPLGAVVDLPEESLMHVATAVAGSGPAYLYALVESLEAAGVRAGLEPDAAARLTRATITGAAALLAQGTDSAADLLRQVTSPGGTTEAALAVLTGAGGLPELFHRAVGAAVHRSAKLGAPLK
jgi:pyrroline-5-carboxylate reductase